MAERGGGGGTRQGGSCRSSSRGSRQDHMLCVWSWCVRTSGNLPKMLLRRTPAGHTPAPSIHTESRAKGSSRRRRRRHATHPCTPGAFVPVHHLWCHSADDGGLGVAAQAVLQDARQVGVAVGGCGRLGVKGTRGGGWGGKGTKQVEIRRAGAGRGAEGRVTRWGTCHYFGAVQVQVWN